MTSHRPTFDDILAEQRDFIGPPAPPQIPKLTPEADREVIEVMLLDELAGRIAAVTSARKASS